MKSDNLEDWNLEEKEGLQIAVPISPGSLGVVVEGGRMFKRNAIKHATTEKAEHVRCLVAELDGVRVYVRNDKILVTKRDVRL